MNKKAFTLIELLVVVLIIGILAAVALPQYFAAIEKSRASEALSVAKALSDSQKRYFLENNEYTGDIAQLDITAPGTFSDENCSRSAPTCFRTQHFEYISGTSGAVAALRIQESSPGNGTPGPYSISIAAASGESNGFIYVAECIDTTGNANKSKKLCTSLGAKYRDGNANWKHYVLF